MHSAQTNVFDTKVVNRLIPIFKHMWHIAYITILFLNKHSFLQSRNQQGVLRLLQHVIADISILYCIYILVMVQSLLLILQRHHTRSLMTSLVKLQFPSFFENVRHLLQHSSKCGILQFVSSHLPRCLQVPTML